jgi:hypothetical protein
MQQCARNEKNKQGKIDSHREKQRGKSSKKIADFQIKNKQLTVFIHYCPIKNQNHF